MVLVPAIIDVVTVLIRACLVPCRDPFGGHGLVRLRHPVVSRQGCCGCLSEGVEKGAEKGNFRESGWLGSLVWHNLYVSRLAQLLGTGTYPCVDARRRVRDRLLLVDAKSKSARRTKHRHEKGLLSNIKCNFLQ